MMVRIQKVVKKKVMCNKQYQVIQGTVWKSNMVCRKRIYEVQDIRRRVIRQAHPTHQSPQVFQGLSRGYRIESIKMNLGTTPGFDLGRPSETLAGTITPEGGTWEKQGEGQRGARRGTARGNGEVPLSLWGERGESTVQTTSDFFNSLEPPFVLSSDILKIRT